jgi:glycosyltransferase involved in cell wall biosynthesis
VRVLIVTHYFPPETGAPQARLSGLAATWAADGDEVTVLTGMPNHPTGVLPPAYRGAIRRREYRDGYRVVRTWLYATPNEGIARKTLGHLSFMASSVLLGGRASGPADVVVVSSPTFFSILSGWLLARRKRARFVIDVRDLWPAIFVQLGVLTNRRVIRLLERLELAAYAAADEVVVVSDGFREDLIRRGVPPEKVHTIRNGADLSRFAPRPEPSGEGVGLRARLGAGPGDCLVLYAGTHGISQALPAVADAAAQLEGRAIRFAFVGEGADKKRLERRVADLGLRNVMLMPSVPSAEMPALLAAADICLVPLRKVPLFASFIPSKMFEYLAAGKAVVGSVTGEAAQILAEAGAVVVPPEDSGSLAAAVAALAADPQLRTVIGRSGRAFAERCYDRAALAREYRKILDLTPRQGSPRPGAAAEAPQPGLVSPLPPPESPATAVAEAPTPPSTEQSCFPLPRAR